jgi:hypothetical protein
MTQNVNTQVTTTPPAPNDPGGGSAPTVTRYQQLALAAAATCDGAISQMPQLQIAIPAKTKFFRSRQRLYSPDLITASVVAVESDPELQGVNRLNAGTGRDRLQAIEAYTELKASLTRSLGNVSFTLDSLKYEATLQALQTYEMAKSMVRDPNSTLGVHVASMAKVIKRLQRRGLAAPKTPTALTTPPAPTTPTVPPSHSGFFHSL